MAKFTGAPGELVIEDLKPNTTYDFDANLVTEDGEDHKYKQVLFTTSLNCFLVLVMMLDL